MRFPRNARVFRGQLDVAPFASVFFLLLLFVLTSSLIYTPGVHVELPIANDLPGTDRPTVTVAVDKNGRLYFENQMIGTNQLKARLEKAVQESSEPLTLMVQADKEVAYENLMRLTLLARDAGINDALFAVLPRVFPAPSTLP